MAAQSGGKAVTNPNAFQGSIRIRRVGPNKAIGEYKKLDTEEIDENDINNEGNTGEGLGKQSDIPEVLKKKMIGNTIPEDAAGVLDDLAYLTIPYVNFEGKVKTGHMIVNKGIASDTLHLFQDLYNIKYPIEKMEIIDTYGNISVEDLVKAEQEQKEDDKEDGKEDQKEDGEEEKKETGEAKKSTQKYGNDLEYKAIDDNNTYSFSYFGENAHTTGNVIAINPRINPKIVNGNAEHKNASKYIVREDETIRWWSQQERKACIQKDKEAYNIFIKYGFTWSGEDSENPNYMDFEKNVVSSSDETKKTLVDTRIYDLSYVPEETFNKYVEENNSRALRVYTLDENKKLTIASWSYTTENGLKISKGKTINYKGALSKYKMPIEYLLTMLQYSENKDFTEGVADLAIDSEYIIAVEDSVRTTQTIKRYETTSYKTYEDTGKTVSSVSVKEDIKVSESASQKIEVTYVDCWFVKYSKDFSFNVISNGISDEGDLIGTQGEEIGEFEITAYCACSTCCGISTGITATGTKVKSGLTIAVDPNVITLGSYVYFNDHVYHAEDTGGAIKGNRIDLYMDSHLEALKWGRKNITVYKAEDVKEREKSEDKEENKDEDKDKKENKDEGKDKEENKDEEKDKEENKGEGKEEEKDKDKDDGEETRKTTSVKNRNPVTATAKIMADVKISSSSTSSSSYKGGIYGPFILEPGESSYAMDQRAVETIINNSCSISYDTGNEYISGNAQKFIDLYKQDKYKSLKNDLNVEWLVEALRTDGKTAPLCEITEYLFSRASKKNYNTNTLKFERYKPGQFKSYGSSGMKTLKEYIHYWECGEKEPASTEDGTKYIVVTDGYGHPTVGYGVDIFNGKYEDRFIAAGYGVTVGAQVDKEFVDALEEETLQKFEKILEENCAGLNLTQYQKHALISRMYNAGPSGSGVDNGNFVKMYDSYWNQSTDDEYKVEWNEGMFNHPLYTQLMAAPITSNGQVAYGLVRRRKSEWILFKTGYYGYETNMTDKWCSLSGDGDFLEVARSVWAIVCEQQPQYSMASSKPVPPGDPIGIIDCSHYVTWVLYELGYTEFEGMQESTYTLISKNWSEKYGWEEIPIGDGDISDELQPGDILVRNGHTCIIVDTSGGTIMAYDCGIGNGDGRWAEVQGTDDPVDSTYFATGNYGSGKIIRNINRPE